MLASIFAGTAQGGVVTGIGDDAAVLVPGEGSLVWTVDVAVEDVHFRRSWLTWQELGFRSLMAAASDLAAMGASPRGILSALILPPHFSRDELAQLARGQADAARVLGTQVIGGNLSSGGELSITTNVLGQAKRVLERRGARPGDVVAVAGSLGLARAGLLHLQRGLPTQDAEVAVGTWRRPHALIAEGTRASEHAHAAIDVSDGLARDLHRLQEHGPIHIIVDEVALRKTFAPALLKAAAQLGEDPLELALTGGEDYALLIATAPSHVPSGFDVIGEIAPGSGVALRRGDGRLSHIEPRGYDHFSMAGSGN